MITFSGLFESFIASKSKLDISLQSKTQTYSVYIISIFDGNQEISEKIPVLNDHIQKFSPSCAVLFFLRMKHIREFFEELVFTTVKQSDLTDVKNMMADNYIIDSNKSLDIKSEDGKEFLDDTSYTVAYKIYIMILKSIENNKGE